MSGEKAVARWHFTASRRHAYEVGKEEGRAEVRAFLARLLQQLEEGDGGCRVDPEEVRGLLGGLKEEALRLKEEPLCRRCERPKATLEEHGHSLRCECPACDGASCFGEDTAGCDQGHRALAAKAKEG